MSQDQAAKPAGPTGDAQAGRQSARGVLIDLEKAADRRADAFRTLRASIMWETLSHKQEEALWRLFITWPR